MDIKINSLQPAMTDPRLVPEFSNKRSRVIKPIPKSKKALSSRVGEDRGTKRESTAPCHSSEPDDTDTADGVVSQGGAQSRSHVREPDEKAEMGTGSSSSLPEEAARRISGANRAQGCKRYQEKKGLLLDAQI